MMIKINDALAGYSIWDGFSNITFQKAQAIYDIDDPKEKFFKLDCHGEEFLEIEKPSCVIAIKGEEHGLSSEFPVIHKGWLATCRKPDGDVFKIFFDTVGYLLNDSGKTIEVIR